MTPAVSHKISLKFLRVPCPCTPQTIELVSLRIVPCPCTPQTSEMSNLSVTAWRTLLGILWRPPRHRTVGQWGSALAWAASRAVPPFRCAYNRSSQRTRGVRVTRSSESDRRLLQLVEKSKEKHRRRGRRPIIVEWLLLLPPRRATGVGRQSAWGCANLRKQVVGRARRMGLCDRRAADHVRSCAPKQAAVSWSLHNTSKEVGKRCW